MKKLLFDIGNLLSGQSIASLFNLTAFSLAANNLGVDDFGRFSIFLSLIVVTSTLFLPKPWVALVKNLKTKEDSLHKFTLYKVTFILEIVFGIVACLGLLVSSTFLPSILNVEKSLFFIAMIPVIFQSTGLFSGILRHKELVNKIRNVEVYSSFFRLAVLLLTTFMYPKNLLAILYAYITYDIIKFVLSYRYSKVKILNIFKVKNSVKQVRYSIYFRDVIVFHFTDLIGGVRREVDTLIVGFVFSLEQVGIYKIIKQYDKIFSLFAVPVKQIFYPYIVNNKSSVNKQLFSLFFIVLSLLTFMLFLLMYNIADITDFLFDKSLIDYRWTLLIFLIGTIIFVASYVLNAYVLARKKSQLVIKLEVIYLFTFYLCFTCLFIFNEINVWFFSVAHLLSSCVYLISNLYTIRNVE